VLNFIKEVSYRMANSLCSIFVLFMSPGVTKRHVTVISTYHTAGSRW